jgi:trigger factor
VKTDVEKLNPTRVKLTVAAPYDELKPYVDAAIKKLSEQVQIPGFRKGKVPARIIETRFGRPAILQEAVNDALPDFYQKAAEESEIRALGRPEVEVTEVPGLEDGSEDGDLVFVVEQDARPEFTLPDFSDVTVEIEEPVVDDDAVDVRLDQLRERFGTLVGVDRPAQDGDFVSLDMTATIGDEEIESVEGVSYHIGEGNMLEGMDEALIGLSAGESTTFTSKLAGGEHEGEDAQIAVTAQSVKVRELPEADDEFAEMASEFDTIDELRADLAEQATKDAESNRVQLARNALLDQLIDELELPVPDQLVEDEIQNHLENEGKEAGDPHGEEIREDTVKAIRAQFVLDAINETREVQVGQNDLMGYISQLSAQYGVEPNQFIQMLAQSGQLEQIFGEVQRSKALDVALGDVTVKTADGKVLELDLGLEDGEDGEADQAPAEAASDDAAAQAPEETAAADEKPAEAEKPAEEKKPAAKKAPAKKATTAKKAPAAKKDGEAKETTAKKAPAKKTAAAKEETSAKKAPAKKTSTAKTSSSKASSSKTSTAKRSTSTKATKADEKSEEKKPSEDDA